MNDIYDHTDALDPEVEKFLESDNLKNLPVIGKYLEKRPKIAVIRMSGVIAEDSRRRTGISHNRFTKIIDRAFEKADTAVVLIINSPGGSPAQSELIGAQIRRLSAEKELPVYAFIEDVAASGGYWLACAADNIYAQNTSIVGSIGVISASFGFDEFIARHDITRRMHTSGKDKSFLDPFLPEKESDLARLAEIQKDIHNIFIDWVKERRGNRLRSGDKSIFEGGFWTAGIAMDHGLIDGIADMDSLLREKFGKKIKFINCTPDKKMLSIPGMPAISAGGFGASGFGVDDVIGAVEKESVWGRYGL